MRNEDIRKTEERKEIDRRGGSTERLDKEKREKGDEERRKRGRGDIQERRERD